ncbi:MAG TPA: GNAT family N-acetyltransferase [Saprospiraceae bacterium]|nr:GNAT family N-acetyltransferase [Saprospiraceae bacterium]HNT20006.1 GNAT family N-acetyltransferase [Saprospiraceae bacterium]
MEYDTPSPVREAGLSDLPKIIPALKILRPHLSDQDFYTMIPVLFEEGYRIIFIGDDRLAYSVAGYRTLNFLYSGKTLYIDDLVTLPDHLKKGYATQLLAWLKSYARNNGFDHFSLDSGFQRKTAHRLYLNEGLEMEGFHFGRKVSDL